jgi:hypothetical protein
MVAVWLRVSLKATLRPTCVCQSKSFQRQRTGKVMTDIPLSLITFETHQLGLVKTVLDYNASHPTSQIILISEAWVFDCITSNVRLTENNYIHNASISSFDSATTLRPESSSNQTVLQSKRHRSASTDKVVVSWFGTDNTGIWSWEYTPGQQTPVQKKETEVRFRHRLYIS